MRRSLLVLAVFFSVLSAYAQQFRSIKIKDPVVCYATAQDHLHYVKPPQQYLDRLENPAVRTTTTNIEVTYIGFESKPEAQQSFQRAIDIWASVLNTTVPIRIEARWTTLGANVLGSANYTSAYANFKGAQKLNVYYPVAIAEKITGRELNNGEADLFANFNSTFDWHYDPNTTPSAGKYDLTTVVLHEIGHGLGFSGTMTISNNEGSYGLLTSDIPIIYDVPIENGSNMNVIESNVTAVELAAMFTSQNLYSDAPSGYNKLYAPAIFSSGSSISHLDETTFNGTSNALMTPQIAAREQIFSPGVSLDMLGDLGWETVVIEHNKVVDSEDKNGPYSVNAIIRADNGYNEASVKLHYSTNGTTFTSIPMAPAGQVNKFSGNILGDGNEHTYFYYISVENTLSVEYYDPGKFVNPKSMQTHGVYAFSVGPDTDAPIIKHTPQAFILDSENEVTLLAEISDNSGQLTAKLQYFVNDIEQPEASLTLTESKEDSIYNYTLDVSSLSTGDILKYRIMVVDNASSPNQSFSPISDYYTVNVVGLEPTQDSYTNNFNSTSDDFFGTGFFITTPPGFVDGAMHTNHPYEGGEGHPSNEFNVVYQLKIPIRVKETDALIKFDEIVLVEPGETGSQFGDDDFYDYVVVEGSRDGGTHWIPVAEGYDARANTSWLTRYNGSKSGDNSTATGDPALYKSRTFNLQNVFDTNDEIVIRFRLFSDQFAVGWGWAIDNLRIQVDENPPLILHDHFDFITKGTEEITLTSKVSDVGGVVDYALELFVNDAEPETIDIPYDELVSEYNYTLEGLDQLTNGDVISYRFVAKDATGNIGSFPADGFIKIKVLEFGYPISKYTNNFDTPTTDFVGNFFNITTPTNFTNGGIHTIHPYPTGRGLNSTSNFSYLLINPVTISENNPIISFKEIALVEGHLNGVAFGTEAFNDYVIVEGSTDLGETWTEFENGYDAIGVTQWMVAINNNASGSSSLFLTRDINMTASGNFEPGDEVLIRFRLFSNATINKWGWAIDDLAIQSIITSAEGDLEETMAVYPNPTKGQFTVEANGYSSSDFTIEVMNLQGQKLYEAREQGVNGKIMHTISSQSFAAGIYLVRIKNGNDSIIRKIMRTN